MDKRFQLASDALRGSLVAVFAYDAAGVCIAREQRPALEAYTSEIDLIDEPACRQELCIRRIVAEQSAAADNAPVTRWAMEYDENGTLTDALEQRLGSSESGEPYCPDAWLKLAQRLRWIGVPGASR